MRLREKSGFARRHQRIGASGLPLMGKRGAVQPEPRSAEVRELVLVLDS
jgi:hypothetical protein